MYFVKTPFFAPLYCRSCVWKVKTSADMIYLTFDDGPDPNVTPDVLDVLDKYSAKATFFCVGHNAVKYPDIIEITRQKGHAIGNHAFSHVKGERLSTFEYVSDVNKSKAILKTDLFRPPYGSITSNQIKELRKLNQIIMWSVLPGDFDKRISGEKVLKRAISYTNKGDIIVFHDNKKFKEKMLFSLDGFLDHFTKLGFRFEVITDDLLNRI